METSSNTQKRTVDLSAYEDGYSLGDKIGRFAWRLVWMFLFRPTPVVCFFWRNLLLRLFGARIGKGAHVYPSCRIWAPWNLELGDFSSLGHRVDCLNAAEVVLGANTTVSQDSFLCTASHDITDPRMKPIVAHIIVRDGAWICAGAYVGPGVTVGEGSVAGARSVVVSDVPAWTVVAGNPAKFIKKRELQDR